MKRVVEFFGHEFEELVSAKELEQIVFNMAESIEEDVFDKQPIFIGVMNGSFRFINDLFSHFSLACEVDFIKCHSYQGTESTGVVKQVIGVSDHIKGRTVIVVEDIIDTGNTIDAVIKEIEKFEPEEVRIATLFFKPSIYKGAAKLDYIGKEIEDHFIIGYGLDIDGFARNLNTIYKKIDSVSLSSSKNKGMLNIVLFGPPGSGKGTQSALLKEKYGLVHISTGDVFRGLDPDSELAKLAKSYADKGNLVPDEITIKILESEVKKHPDAKGVIYDGFPRTQAQAEALDKFLESKGTSVSCMLALDVEENELRERLKGRALESGRPDDADPMVIQNRIDVYNAQTAIVAEFYKDQGKYKAVNGHGSISEITQKLFSCLDEVVA